MDLKEKKCTPCEGATSPLQNSEEDSLIQHVNDWSLERDKEHHIHKKFKFADFKQAMQFVNAIADIANDEDHHPDISISYNKVGITLSTHKIGGLSENDFIVASKIDNLHVQEA
ncbi:MAG: 4a-hydroxytetrahydrobiopterin dehydratase [Chitinivibrionales bacterium]|nr:4a-hydroxytetrahydrobiopterin dehydratase [Chitinivibrionales bacterium]